MKKTIQKFTVVLILVFNFLNIHINAQNITGKNVAIVEKKIDSLLMGISNQATPGYVVTIVKDGQIILNKGYGLAQIENQIPNTPETAFNIGSVAKQFTAMAITMLEKQGRLSVDDDIHKYLPEMPEYDKKITIRHLLHHTSGIRDDLHLWVMAGNFFGDVLDQQEIYSLTQRQKHLFFPPGSQFGYSDSNYTLLAMIVSKVTGQSFESWIQDNIFSPLDMKSSIVLENPGTIIRNRAFCYYSESDEFKYMPLNNAYPGPSNIYATGNDMAEWLLNFETKEVGGEEVFKAMLTPGQLDNGEKINYARGLEIGTYRGNNMITHGGTEGSFNTELVYYPDGRLGIVVLSNFDSNPNRLVQNIANIFIQENELQPQNVQSENTANQIRQERKTIKLSKEQTNAFIGTWFSDNWRLRNIIVENKKLYYVRSINSKTELKPISETELNLVGSDIIIKFDNLKNGLYTKFVFNFGSPQASNAERIEPFAPSEEKLKEYEGLYYSGELDALHRFVMKNGKLYNSKMKWERDVPLSVAMKDKLTFINGEGHVSFKRDEQDRIVGYILYVPRVGEIEFKKLEL